jgi:TPR repeat protein
MIQMADLVVDPDAPQTSIPNLVNINKRPSCALCGVDAPKSNIEHVSRLERLAEAGNVHAQYQYADRIKQKDKKAAFRWLQRAADGGHKAACVRVGEWYRDGVIVAQSYEEARAWYERGLNNAVALTCLGVLYKQGKGVQKDDAKALEYFRRAAEQDYPNGILNYGLELRAVKRYKDAWVQFERGAMMEDAPGRLCEDVSKCQYFAAQTINASIGNNDKWEHDPLPLSLFWMRRAARNENERAKADLKALEKEAHSECRHCGNPEPKIKCAECRAASYCDKVSDL